MPMWFNLAHTDGSFARQVPFYFETLALLAAPPERAFAIVAEPEDMAAWLPGFRHCRWASSGPHGVGSRRELALRGVAFREHFLAWEPGRRLCFAIDAMTAPLMRRMVEDLYFLPAGEG